jgi:FolB domain-containing protein
MDYITISDLRIKSTHGHYDHERRVEQEFLVSLRVGFDAHTAAVSDRLPDTIDFDDLRKITEQVFSGKSYYLVEALAEEIAQRILKETVAREVSVSIQKTMVWEDAVPGISITRTKQ